MSYIPEPSYKDYLTHKIKKDDTLISVAQELGIDPYVLRTYHNKFCPLKDLIEAEFPYQLEFLILAPEKIELSDDEKEKQRKKVVFNNAPFTISFDYAQINNSYGVMYTIENGEEIHTIKQEINVSWKAKSENGFIFLK
ncbi:MAG: hypothetical protein ABI576_02920 [Flavobacterium sp.]